ncbi:MAG: PHP domain-containing protein, partial [Selenomonadaceae bacterium]|nr:PHP domain-containing protein [Selenomonadaceae bacterium]
MDRYRLKIDDEKNFFRLFDDAKLNFGKCTLKEVIVTPGENLWQIFVVTEKNFDDQTLRAAEEFLHRRYHAEVEIRHAVTIGTEIVPAEKKSPRKKNEPREKNSARKKISGEVTKIANITEDSGTVIIIGEVSADDVNGVKIREFKNGTACVSFCVIDDTDGICCKKFFKGDKKSDAQPFADTIKPGGLVKISGTTKYDDYLKETVLFINALELLENDKTTRQDTADVKRVELHVHTQMSAMDAVIPVDKLIKTAADWGWSSVAITDHGVIQAFPFAAQAVAKLAKAGKKIKIIYGMEGYLVGEDYKQKHANHVIILARNKIGLGNLYRLVSISQLRFMYYRPRIPKEILSDMREGLIIGSACEAGEVIRAIVEGKTDAELEEIAAFYDYLEIQPIHNNDFLIRSEDFPNITSDEDLRDINRKVAALAKKLGKP